MNKLAIVLAGIATAVAAVPAAAAPAPAPWQQGWQSINQRQANIDRRIDQGVRRGTLNRNEAQRLRIQFRDLNRLEQQYRRSGRGLTLAERRDLDRRFDRLAQRVYNQKHDRQTAWR
ncbi:hypothetical protein D1610_06455 [Sphingomonas gilva]|uniref:Uncharacterized protein n=1 Tax=Sphingomonas gilva TaxID=2305907 RepID=A0A396RNP9_9SPHN|nr:hypothetical protein [Sphingomonas gilva]RHW18124.1 hypothetical protein D1610_06455 [Sphingomonas gilva]